MNSFVNKSIQDKKKFSFENGVTIFNLILKSAIVEKKKSIAELTTRFIIYECASGSYV